MKYGIFRTGVAVAFALSASAAFAVPGHAPAPTRPPVAHLRARLDARSPQQFAAAVRDEVASGEIDPGEIMAGMLRLASLPPSKLFGHATKAYGHGSYDASTDAPTYADSAPSSDWVEQESEAASAQASATLLQESMEQAQTQNDLANQMTSAGINGN